MDRVKRLPWLAALLGLAILAPSAAASSGAITRAYADPAWTRGSFAGQVTWTDCAGFCKWLPVATVQPTLPVYRCLGDEVLDSDPNTYMVWSGGNHTTNEIASFDIGDVPILYGVQGQRLCVSVIETRRIQEPVCLVQAPILGLDPSTCPLVDKLVPHVVATTLLSLAPPTPLPTSPTTDPPENAAPAIRPRNVAKVALARRFGKRWKRASAKQVTCRSLPNGWACRVSWRYAGRRFKGKVLVSRTGKSTVRVKRLGRVQ